MQRPKHTSIDKCAQKMAKTVLMEKVILLKSSENWSKLKSEWLKKKSKLID